MGKTPPLHLSLASLTVSFREMSEMLTSDPCWVEFKSCKALLLMQGVTAPPTIWPWMAVPSTVPKTSTVIPVTWEKHGRTALTQRTEGGNLTTEVSKFVPTTNSAAYTYIWNRYMIKYHIIRPVKRQNFEKALGCKLNLMSYFWYKKPTCISLLYQIRAWFSSHLHPS